MDDATLRRSLASVVVPGELEARRRSWTVVRTAFDDRETVPRPLSRRWPIAVAAAAVVVLAAALTPPGRAVLGSVRDAIGREKVVGVKGASPSLFSLPARGNVLATSSRGPWIVHPDGSRRLLGHYADATWSPFGHFVAVARGNALSALDPSGHLRWTLARPAVSDPRWGGTLTDTRVAYLSRGGLHVVAGDGTGDKVLVAPVALVAPAWKPGSEHVLAYATPGGAVRIIDTDSGHVTGGWRESSPQQLAFSSDGKLVAARDPRLLSIYTAHALRVAAIHSTDGEQFVDAAWAPTLPTLADVQYDRVMNRSAVFVVDREGRGTPEAVFSGAGRISSVTWSPDGRWLLVAWDSADQWVFVRTGDGATKVVARSSISEQLNGTARGTFPAVAGWSP
jgi:hypothetical protein